METEPSSSDVTSDVDHNEVATQPGRIDWTGVTIFLVLTFAISWSIFLGLRFAGVPFFIRASLGMFGPAIAALLVRLIRREGFADAGLRLVKKGRKGAGWMYLAAYVIPPLVIAAGIGLVLLSGYQHWAFNENLQKFSEAIRQQVKTLPAGTTPEQI